MQQVAAQHLPPLLCGKQRLGLYWPLPGEADLRGLGERPELAERLALPRVEGGALRYRAWRSGDLLSNDATRIPAPDEGSDLPAAALGLLLAPALASDRRGIRLGYGGGWFDRLRSDPLWAGVPALAVLPAGCVVDELPCDSWDLPFNGWLDEQGLHWLHPV
jgi:5-formyltetrahydrofolate cyclo-ligase